jgi:large subunit ribosomal protein L9
MEVILLERIEKVGKLGDVVKVKDGFARNYLLPQNKALRANKVNLSIYENEKAKYEKLNKEKLSAAEKIAKNMQNISISIIKQASDSGQLYGSVSTRDIADELNNQGHKIEKKQIVLKSVIKIVGQHEVRVVIHPEFIINIEVNIARTLEELTMQNAEIEKIVEEKNENDDSIKASENISNKEDKLHKENKIEKDVKNITEKKS